MTTEPAPSNPAAEPALPSGPSPAPVNYGLNWLKIFAVLGIVGGLILVASSIGAYGRANDASVEAGTRAQLTALDAAANLQTVGITLAAIGIVALLLTLVVAAVRFEIRTLRTPTSPVE